jgi:hypothetical protein
MAEKRGKKKRRCSGGNRMKLKWSFLFTFFCLTLAVFISACKEQVKEPAVAGMFYPADETSLRKTVNFLLASAEAPPVEGKLLALISPHAGYEFSGRIASFSYKHLKERDIKTVILIGPSHHALLNGASVYTKGSFKTPLGNVRIDEKLAGSLLNEKVQVTFRPDVFEKEHSLEVQLPFLQETLKDFKVVPILLGSPTQASFEHLTEKISEILIKNDKAILIASSDLSHYHDYNAAAAMDKKIIDAIARMSVEDVQRYLTTGECEMCGGYPVLYTMVIAKRLGATNGMIYAYENSGDVTGNKSSVVGYAAIGLYKSALTKAEKDELLSLAKKTITDYVTDRKAPDFVSQNPKFAANAATFVTINRKNSLRGCIGNIQPIMPLSQSVIHNSVSASTNDSRFPPMIMNELKDMEVEISVLSPLEPLKDIRDIEIGKHGLFIVSEQNSGLLLPQVATAFGWDKKTFLEQVSQKAGLQKDAWRESKLYVFTADIIR